LGSLLAPLGSLLAPLGAESSLGLIVSSLGRRAQLLGRVRFAPRGATTHRQLPYRRCESSLGLIVSSLGGAESSLGLIVSSLGALRAPLGSLSAPLGVAHSYWAACVLPPGATTHTDTFWGRSERSANSQLNPEMFFSRKRLDYHEIHSCTFARKPPLTWLSCRCLSHVALGHPLSATTPTTAPLPDRQEPLPMFRCPGSPGFP
jgi:hypothetical protein